MKNRQQLHVKRIALLTLVFVALFFPKAMAHPLGLTFTNVKYSKETLTLSTRIFYGDFWQEFQQTAKVKNKDYVKTGIDDNDKKDFSNYINKNLRIWINNKEIHFNTININFERHEEDAYILIVNLTYNVKNPNGAKIKIKNTILLNTIGGQKHMINFYMKDPNTLSHGIITLDKSTPECKFVNE